MSVQAMTYVLEHSEASGAARLILLLVANHAGNDDWSTWVSATTLAREARMSERQVRRIIARLQHAGELHVEPRPGRSAILRLPTPDKMSGVREESEPAAAPEMSGVTASVASRTPDIAMSATPDTAMSDEPSEPSGDIPESSLTPFARSRARVRPSADHGRARDEIFEALFVLEAGEPYSPEASRRLTRRARDALNAAAAEIRATGVSAEELRAAIAAWPRVMPPRASCTPSAVAKHLARLLAASRGVVFRAESEFEAEVRRAQELYERAKAEREVAAGG